MTRALLRWLPALPRLIKNALNLAYLRYAAKAPHSPGSARCSCLFRFSASAANMDLHVKIALNLIGFFALFAAWLFAFEQLGRQDSYCHAFGAAAFTVQLCAVLLSRCCGGRGGDKLRPD